MKKIRKKCNNKGQSLAEAVMVLALIGIVLSGIAVAVTTGISNSTFLNDQSVANKYAQDGIEFIRNIKKADYATFVTYSGTKCFKYTSLRQIDSTNPFISGPCTTPDPNTGNKYIHEAIFEPNGCDVNTKPGTKVTVNVSWSSPKCPSSNAYCHTAQLVSCFTDNSLNPAVGGI